MTTLAEQAFHRVMAIPNADDETLAKCGADVRRMIEAAEERVAVFIFLLLWNDVAATAIFDRTMLVQQSYEIRHDDPLADWSRSIAGRIHGA